MNFENNTPFPAIAWPSYDHNDYEHITFLSRVKYKIFSVDSEGLVTLRLDQDQGELLMADEFYNSDDEDESYHVRYESDYIPFKSHADLVINVPLGENGGYQKRSVKLIRYTQTEEKIEGQILIDTVGLDSYGFVHRADDSRTQYLGTTDEKWIEERLPKLPRDFDERHYNSAQSALQLNKGYFEAGDIVELHGFGSYGSPMKIMLPGIYIIASYIKNMRNKQIVLSMDTILIDIEDLDIERQSIYISYRTRVQMDGMPETILFDMQVDDEFIDEEVA